MEDLLTVREVARALRVDETTVRRWIKEGVMEAIRLPHRSKRMGYRVNQTTISGILQTGKVEPTPPTEANQVL